MERRGLRSVNYSVLSVAALGHLTVMVTVPSAAPVETNIVTTATDLIVNTLTPHIQELILTKLSSQKCLNNYVL